MKSVKPADAQPTYLVVGEYDDMECCWTRVTECASSELAAITATAWETDNDCRCATAYRATEITDKD